MLIRNPEQAFNLGETASGEPQLYLTRRSMPPSEVTHQHRCARLPDAERPKRRRTVRLTMAGYGAVAFLLMLITRSPEEHF